MTPFGFELSKIMASRQVKQCGLADSIGVHPSYLSAVMHGRKGRPGKDLIQKVAAALGLETLEIEALYDAAANSFRELELPLDANSAERRVARQMVNSMGRLLPEQLKAIESILDLTPRAQPTICPVREVAFLDN